MSGLACEPPTPATGLPDFLSADMAPSFHWAGPIGGCAISDTYGAKSNDAPSGIEDCANKLAGVWISTASTKLADSLRGEGKRKADGPDTRLTKSARDPDLVCCRSRGCLEVAQNRREA